MCFLKYMISRIYAKTKYFVDCNYMVRKVLQKYSKLDIFSIVIIGLLKLCKKQDLEEELIEN